MIRVAICSNKKEEIKCIRQLVLDYSIQHSWADCQLDEIKDSGQLAEMEKEVDILIPDMAAVDMAMAVKIQKLKYPPVLIFPLAGPEIPPTVYVCPEIMPCGLFWRPINEQTARPVIEQMMAQLHDREIPKSQSCFRIEGKQKVQDIPFASILFFEAKDKKLMLRMKDTELVFHGTLGQLEENLTKDFIRCHKSFIVNRKHILSVDRTNGIINLDNQMELPLSRSYKKSFWEVFHDNN